MNPQNGFTSLEAAIHRISSLLPLHPPSSRRELEREEVRVVAKVGIGFPRILQFAHMCERKQGRERPSLIHKKG
jgi:hypothetical protein